MKSKFKSVNEQIINRKGTLLDYHLHSLHRRGFEGEDIIECPVCNSESLMVSMSNKKATATCGHCSIKATVEF